MELVCLAADSQLGGVVEEVPMKPFKLGRRIYKE